MRVLQLEGPPGDERTGVFTCGVVSVGGRRRLAVFFTRRQHAGENLAVVLQPRAAELAPSVQMCDALSRNEPKLGPGCRCSPCLCQVPKNRDAQPVISNLNQMARPRRSQIMCYSNARCGRGIWRVSAAPVASGARGFSNGRRRSP